MTYDFLIIGGGIAGISAGARLAPLGSSLVLEAEDHLAYHASGRSAALYEAKYGLPPTIALNEASYTHHATAHGGVLSPRGFLMLAGPDDIAAFEHDCETMGLTEIPAEAALAKVPILNLDHLSRAAYADGASDIDTDKLVHDFARDIRQHGGRIDTGARVTDIQRTPQGWTVGDGDKTHRCKTLINAAGAWADQIARLAGIAPLGLTPLRRSVARMPAPGGHDVTGWPMLFGPGETWYAKPDAGAWIVSPADEDPAEPHDAWADDMVLAEGIARYQPFVTEDVTWITSSWAGLRTFTPDRCLALGPDKDDPSFIWVAGQGGYGMQTSPAASQLVADLIAGRAPEIDAATVAALNPARFR
ncbi:MAG: FAD-binding oxidoreductase [Pseudomonadota bacterium]